MLLKAARRSPESKPVWIPTNPITFRLSGNTPPFPPSFLEPNTREVSLDPPHRYTEEGPPEEVIAKMVPASPMNRETREKSTIATWTREAEELCLWLFEGLL